MEYGFRRVGNYFLTKDESREIQLKFSFRRVGNYFLVMHKKQWMDHVKIQE